MTFHVPNGSVSSNEELLLLVIKDFSNGMRTRADENGMPILGGSMVLDDANQTAPWVIKGLQALENALTAADIDRFNQNQ
jgi:hypothetical protein